MGMLSSENANKTSSTKNTSKSSPSSSTKNPSSSSTKASTKSTSSKTKNTGSSAPANPASLSSSSSSNTSKPSSSASSASKNPVSLSSGFSSSDSSNSKSTSKAAPRAPAKNPVSLSSTSAFTGQKKSTASPVVREGPSWYQFDDFVNNPESPRGSSQAAAGTTWRDLLTLQQLGQQLGPANPMALDTYGQDIPGNPLEEAIRAGEERRAQRAADGVTPSEGAFDWNGILYDMNAPYRQRVEDAGGPPFEGPVDWEGIGAALFGGPSKEQRDYASWLERQGLPADYRPVPVGHGAPGKPRGARDVDPESGFVRDPVTGAYYREDLLPDRTSWAESQTAAAEPAPTNPLDGLLAGIEAEKRRLAGELPEGQQVPLPRPRPAYAGMGGIDTAQLPGQTEGMSDEALYALNHPITPPKETTVWDKVVEGGGKLLENTALGGVVKGLFPDIWYGAGEAMKGIGGDAAPRKYTDTNQWPFSSPEGTGSLAEPVPNYRPQDFPDLNHNGIDDRLEGYVPPPVVTPPTGTPSPNQYDRFGTAVFPDMPPYNPGRDDEWLYFRKNLADGGMVRGYAEGGEVDPLAGQDDPRMEVIAEAEDALEDIVDGEKPGPEEEAALRKFVELFGDAALRQLHDNVKSGMKMRPGKGRMVSGPGGPKDDAIPAMIDGEEPAALSDGEFVLPAEAVMGAGGGDRERGAAALQELSDRLSSMRKAPAGKAA